MKYFLTTVLVITLLVFSFAIVVDSSLAATAPSTLTGAQATAKAGLEKSAKESTLELGSPAKSIGAALKILLSILGIIFLIIVVYAGITWMLAGGNDEQVTKARKMLLYGVIGMVICLAAFSLTQYVVDKIGTETGLITSPTT